MWERSDGTASTPTLAEERFHRLRGAGLLGPHVSPELCHPVIWDLVWIPRQAQLGKLEVRGLQASVCHFQLGSYTSVPASPHPAPPCPEVLGHLSLDTPGGAILRQSGPSEPTSTCLPFPGPPGWPSFPRYACVPIPCTSIKCCFLCHYLMSKFFKALPSFPS